MKNLFKPKNTALIVLFVLTYLLYFAMFFMTLRYSKLNLLLYFTLFVVLLIIILFFTILFYEGIVERKKKLRSIGVVGLVVLSLLLGLVSFYLFRVNASISKVISDPNQLISVETAFVTYDNSKIKDIKDFKSRLFKEKYRFKGLVSAIVKT